MPAITRGLATNPPAVPEGKAKLRLFDDKLTGFIMEVRTSGTITFYVRYRDARNRQREVRLGKLGDITVEQARRRAQELRAEASLGGDPAGDRDRLRSVPTFGQFVEERYLPFAKERLRSYTDHEGFYRLRLKGLWGNRPLDEVRPHEVADLQDRLRRAGLANATVNRYVAFVRRVFNLALRWEAYQGRNPAQHAEMRREHNRERFLTETELRALFMALRSEPNKSAAHALAFLAATGARRGEALGAKWEHIDYDRRLWTVPVSKSGRRRHIPLSDAALAILERQRPWAPGTHIFPGSDPDKALADPSKAWRRAKEMAGLDKDLRIHDLRHTFASTLVGKGRSLHEVGTLLGHSQISMTMRYAHLAPARLIEAANEALPAVL
ncbi:MAG: site-specific integrase [Pseudomonadota bacterium]|nr:site-specific integrase [Pseudomonadota bacterium]